jgi:predicted O-linked N-acetylglucosamine transferase (SPINDLY family)
MATIAEALTQAVEQHQAGRYQQAEQIYRRILQAQPANADALHLLGLLAFQLGQAPVAVDYLRQALALCPEAASFHANLGLVLQAGGQHEEAAACFRQALWLQPDFPEAHYNLGNALREQAELDDAIACYHEALRLRPNYQEAYNNLGAALLAQGRAGDAVSVYRQAMQVCPAYPEAHNNLGNALRNLALEEEAITAYQQAIGIKPDYAEAHYNLGNVFKQQGRLPEAAACFDRAFRLKPEMVDALINLGDVFLAQGQLEQAAACCRRVLQCRPQSPDAHVNLGNVLQKQGQLEHARDCYFHALRLCPDFAPALNNLGIVFRLQGRLETAIACCQRALKLQPNLAEAHINLGNAHRQQGSLTEAVASYQEALRRRADLPEALVNLGHAFQEQGLLAQAITHYRQALLRRTDTARLHSCVLFCLSHDPTLSRDDLFAEHRLWGERYGTPGTPPPAHTNDPLPQRRLRVGYLSPDFLRHPVTRFIEPVLANHDATFFEVYGYAEVPGPDEVTERLRALTHGWRVTCGLADTQLAQQIRTDRIDILVDLAGHTSRHRLLVFAHKPAPVQVTWIGYPHTTGLPAMDYRITDGVMDPPGEPRYGTEQLVRLPCGHFCYAPPLDAPEAGPLPVRRTGRLTLGSLHKLTKLNDAVLDLWCRLLQTLPSARLLLFRNTLVGEARANLARQFEERGIGPDRLELRHVAGEGGYWSVFDEIDIGLDPFPYTGGTMSCESLWMGVPFVTLRGDRPAGRAGAAMLTIVGLHDLIASTPDEVVERTAVLAKDLNRLAEIRAGLRERMRKTLCDGRAFTRSLEAAYRQMWQRWCEGNK